MVIPALRGLAVLLLVSFVTGCAAYREPEATEDATPPPGYAPVFLTSVAPIPEKKPATAGLALTRADHRDPKMMRIYAHVLDTVGTYYTGGAKRTGKLSWCKVSETLDGTTKDVRSFTVREITELDNDPVAIAIVMDNSGSMGDTRARAMQSAVADFLAVKRPQDAVALIRYDHTALIESPVSANADFTRSNLKQNGLEGFGGGTAIHSGIAAAIDHLNEQATSGQRKAVIVFTDGQENSSSITKDAMIAKALASNIVVCGVDFGMGINEGYMEGIARTTGGSYSHIYGTREFRPMFEDVYRRIRNSYVIEYPVTGYGKHTVSVRFCWGKDTVTSTMAYDNTPDVGAIALLNVTFDHGKATLDAESKTAVDNMVMLMKAFPAMTIEVRGHTDASNSSNDPEFNRKLSQKRAEAVRDALVKGGIAATRITATGYGDAEPIASNDSDEGRAQNRRTEFKIISR